VHIHPIHVLAVFDLAVAHITYFMTYTRRRTTGQLFSMSFMYVRITYICLDASLWAAHGCVCSLPVSGVYGVRYRLAFYKKVELGSGSAKVYGD
jgi:hypothetical protein